MKQRGIITNKFVCKLVFMFTVIFRILRRPNEATPKSALQNNEKTTISLKQNFKT